MEALEARTCFDGTRIRGPLPEEALAFLTGETYTQSLGSVLNRADI